MPGLVSLRIRPVPWPGVTGGCSYGSQVNPGDMQRESRRQFDGTDVEHRVAEAPMTCSWAWSDARIGAGVEGEQADVEAGQLDRVPANWRTCAGQVDEVRPVSSMRRWTARGGRVVIVDTPIIVNSGADVHQDVGVIDRPAWRVHRRRTEWR